MGEIVSQCFPYISLRIFLCIGFFGFSLLINANGQEIQVLPQNSGEQVGRTEITVIDMTEQDLRQSYHDELLSVKFNESPDQLDYLLKQAGDRVVAFFRDFLNASSNERVKMFRIPAFKYAKDFPLNTKGSGNSRFEEYQYLILPGSGNTEASWVEYRTDKEHRPINQKALPGFMISSGYAGYCLYLHPNHQTNSRFRYLGRERKKPYAHVIAFAQNPETGDYLSKYSIVTSPTPTRFLVQGFVWLDPDSCQILRMRTDMLLPERQTMLMETITDIHYGKVQFDNPRREFWLPQEIEVSWEFPLEFGNSLIYRNHHKYSTYHFFTVDTDYKITLPKVDK
jgi:hypothetical protein